MISIKYGDIVNASEGIIAHQCNAQGIMFDGVAGSLRNKWPEIYNPYKEMCSSGAGILGKVSTVKCDDKFVVSIIAQEDYGQEEDVVYTDYTALREGLEKVYALAKKYNMTVALPYRIGCGLTNGDWSIVYSMIEDIFIDVPVKLYIGRTLYGL